MNHPGIQHGTEQNISRSLGKLFFAKRSRYSSIMCAFAAINLERLHSRAEVVLHLGVLRSPSAALSFRHVLQ